MNRLGRERSPYLLQHANNAVDWYPWGDEAFARARAEDKPIFLSVGYSTCHWCHVMEHESFEHAGIAAVLNEQFVPVKVDREERPDVDRVYMTFVQGTTGAGGWPMSVFLTPALKPFFGGTYFPPESRWGRPGFLEMIREIAAVWQRDRVKIEQSADSVTEQLRASVQSRLAPAVPTEAALLRIVDEFRATFDSTNAGFGGAPKFPRPSELLFLLREYARTGSREALAMVVPTLRAMALGGMRDHIGGGFHRYSVDAGWRVPHFEKMLYDQAQLVLAYLEAAQAASDPFFLEIAEDTLQYLRREMTSPEGGFYSAEDADSVPAEHAADPGHHKMEGAYYLWTEFELHQLLGEDAALACRRFGVEANGNAPADPQGEFAGKNILYVAEGIDALARRLGPSESEIEATLSAARVAMFRARMQRPRPLLDDKVLTAWNGLTIAAFARAARVLGALGDDGRHAGAPYLEAARRAAMFIRERLWQDETATLLRRFRDGHAEIEAYAEDYAYLVSGVLELFQSDPEPRWLEWAAALQRRQDELFWDEAGGGWFSTTGRDPSVLARLKEDYDGAEPTVSSIAVMNLLTLTHLIHEPVWIDRIERTFRGFGARLEQLGRGVPMMAAALSGHLAGLRQVVVVGDQGTNNLVRRLALRYQPFTLVLRLDTDQQRQLGDLLPWIAAMTPIDGQPTAYVCRSFVCAAPVTTADDLDRLLLTEA